MLSLNSIARVVLNPSSAASSVSAFDVSLILTPGGASVPEAARLRIYDSGSAAAAGLLADGFQESSEAYQAALKYFAASPAPSRLLVSAFPSSESPSEALAAVLSRTSAFYGVYLCTPESSGAARTAALLALEESILASARPMMLFAAVTGSPEEAAASGGLLASLSSQNANRALVLYSGQAADAAAVMGLAMGLTLAGASSAFSLYLKRLQAVAPSDLTEEQISALRALSGNVYVVRGYTRSVLEPGTTCSGRRYDEVLELDRIAEDLQSAAVSLLADSASRLPQTDDATAQFVNAFSSVLARYADRGVLATGPWRGAAVGPLSPGDVLENGFTFWADSYDLQPDADRAVHKAMPISVALCPAGSVESVVITVNVGL